MRACGHSCSLPPWARAGRDLFPPHSPDAPGQDRSLPPEGPCLLRGAQSPAWAPGPAFQLSLEWTPEEGVVGTGERRGGEATGPLLRGAGRTEPVVLGVRRGYDVEEGGLHPQTTDPSPAPLPLPELPVPPMPGLLMLTSG